MGKFICLYGINNLGKSTQVELLERSLLDKGFSVATMKYPIYELPTGKLINSILRDPEYKDFDQTAKQLVYTANRFEHQETLKSMLENHDYVIAEDYVGTGLAWGEANGADPQYLKDINAPLLKADIEILMDGERFTSAIEKNHAHETNSDMTERCRAIHLRLASEQGWSVVNANQSMEDVQTEILGKILN